MRSGKRLHLLVAFEKPANKADDDPDQAPAEPYDHAINNQVLHERWRTWQ
jgi:hypothetical protein